MFSCMKAKGLTVLFLELLISQGAADILTEVCT